ncbi:hypothetical protein Tco_0450599 [Tanacetum coccineum]
MVPETRPNAPFLLQPNPNAPIWLVPKSTRALNVVVGVAWCGGSVKVEDGGRWGGGDGVWLRAAAAVDDEGVSNGDDDETKVMKDVMGMKMVVDMGCFGVGDGCGARPESWLDKNRGAGICYSGREGRDGNESVGFYKK